MPTVPCIPESGRLQVGRVPLYLLDTNFAANTHDEDRDLTDYLYGGGNELRVRQEIMLGIGGYRALKLLGLHPQVYHVNEGHSAFLALEHIRQLMQSQHMSFEEAQVAASASIVFTTHTPVEAGHDRFPPELMDEHMVPYAKAELKLSRRKFLALGREKADADDEFFGMTKLALRMSASSNGVAQLHGEVSRAMWQRCCGPTFQKKRYLLDTSPTVSTLPHGCPLISSNCWTDTSVGAGVKSPATKRYGPKSAKSPIMCYGRRMFAGVSGWSA